MATNNNRVVAAVDTAAADAAAADAAAADAAAADVADSTSNDLEVLRTVLLAPNSITLEKIQSKLAAIEQRISDPESRALDTSEVLAEAVAKRLAADDRLGGALKPILVEQFRATSREEPELMADALFPILGPAVRKMIFNIISPEKKDIKQKGYRLEQLFLIHKLTGLPVCHVASESASTRDADMVSGMLNAIQSFVQEAFETNEFDSLDTLQVGDLSVWIEWGPEGVVAAVVRGVPPKSLREALQILIERIHAQHKDDLSAYEGDASPFEPLRPELTQFLVSHDGSLKNRIRNLPEQARKKLVIGGGIVACLLVWYAYTLFDAYRWQSHVDAVEAMPGIVVTDHERGFGHYRMSGLRDPLAVNPRTLLDSTSINAEKVEYQLEPYQATHSEFILQRAKSLLSPPRGVTIKLFQSVLHIEGVVDRQWATDATKFARTLVGIDKVIINSDSTEKLK